MLLYIYSSPALHNVIISVHLASFSGGRGQRVAASVLYEERRRINNGEGLITLRRIEKNHFVINYSPPLLSGISVMMGEPDCLYNPIQYKFNKFRAY